MASIGKKIRLAFSRKKSEITETIRFPEVRSYIEGFRESERVAKDHSLLIKNYEEFTEKLGDVKKELKILEKKGEKRFTKIVNEKLEDIEGLEEFNLSSYREFCVDTTQIIHSLIRIPARIQRKTLNYENGKETIDALNSFLKSFRYFENALSEITATNSEVEHDGDALKKYEEMKDSLRNKENLESRIESLEREEGEKRERLEREKANLQVAQSKIDGEAVIEIKKRVVSLDNRIREIGSDLKINLRKGRRPISKILHSKDRKLFVFFQRFTEHPLESLNERFWEIITILERETIDLGEKDRRMIDDFLNFSKNRLNDMIREYEDAKAKKKDLEEDFSEISLRNQKLLRDFELRKEIAQNEVMWITKRLDEIVRERNKLETDIKKNARMLERMLSKISNKKVKIDLTDDN